MVGEPIALAAVVRNGKAVFFPGLVEKRNHGVVKEVKEIAESLITGAQPGENERRIEMRERALWTGGAHEVDSERWGLPFRPIDGLNFAGGESERGVSTDAR